MKQTNDLMKRINERYSKMSKGQKMLATYISEQYDKAAFLTAAKLGQTVGVSESTVVRFAMTLGYGGYPEFQKDLEAMVKEKLSEAPEQTVIYENLENAKVLDAVLMSDVKRIEHTIRQVDEQVFEMAVDMIHNAKRIYIVGIRSCAPLAQFLSFYLNVMYDQVKLITTNSASEMFEQMMRISKDDVVIGISFPRYSMRTLKALEFANNRSAKIISLTDSVHSPMNLYSSCNLIAESSMSGLVDSLVAPMSIINALIVALSKKRQHQVLKNLDELEKLWDQYQVYGSDELEYVSDAMKFRYKRPEGNE
ncbi:transcriptional regulator, RpiR family [Lachnospiraceae bacterium XBB1006]|nr:transcriptional regulator, RpiR family [Lachnospiraceae bacterium XBB1006]